VKKTGLPTPTFFTAVHWFPNRTCAARRSSFLAALPAAPLDRRGLASGRQRSISDGARDGQSHVAELLERDSSKRLKISESWAGGQTSELLDCSPSISAKTWDVKRFYKQLFYRRLIANPSEPLRSCSNSIEEPFARARPSFSHGREMLATPRWRPAARRKNRRPSVKPYQPAGVWEAEVIKVATRKPTSRITEMRCTGASLYLLESAWHHARYGTLDVPVHDALHPPSAYDITAGAGLNERPTLLEASRHC